MAAVKTPVIERKASRRKLAAKGHALSDGSFLIPNVDYLGRAIKAVGRAAPGKRPALARLIRKRAKQLGTAGLKKLKGSWADNTQSATEMANALSAQLIECGYTPAQAALELTRTMPLLRPLELASYDPDNDGDDDASASGDTDNDYAGKLSPRALAVMKKLCAKGWPEAKAFKFAQQVDKRIKSTATTANLSRSIDLAGHWVGLGRGKGWKYIRDNGSSKTVSDLHKQLYDAHRSTGKSHTAAMRAAREQASAHKTATTATAVQSAVGQQQAKLGTMGSGTSASVASRVRSALKAHPASTKVKRSAIRSEATGSSLSQYTHGHVVDQATNGVAKVYMSGGLDKKGGGKVQNGGTLSQRQATLRKHGFNVTHKSAKPGFPEHLEVRLGGLRASAQKPAVNPDVRAAVGRRQAKLGTTGASKRMSAAEKRLLVQQIRSAATARHQMSRIRKASGG